MTAAATPSAVFEERDGSVVIDPAVMEIERPYPFRFHGEWCVAVKRRGGDVDTYTVRENTGPNLPRWLGKFRLAGIDRDGRDSA